MTKYEDLTYEDKQAALDGAHKNMNPDERLDDIEKYANNCFATNIAPILRKDELEFLISTARQALEGDTNGKNSRR